MTIKQLRERFLVFLAHDLGLRYFRTVRRQRIFPWTLQSLSALPEDTVGRRLYLFMVENNLNLLPYYEKHDIKHVILDYPPTDRGEVCLQVFMLANGRMTIPVLMAVIYGMLTMPEYYAAFKQAWQRGRATASLKHLDWFGLIPLPVAHVKKHLFEYRRNSLAQLIHQL